MATKMRSSASTVFTTLLLAAAEAFSDTTDAAIVRDVVIVGGGASGAHAAVQLRDMGKTIALVEKRDRLGGHTETHHDPATGKNISVGVQAWNTYKNSTNFITERMNMSIMAKPQTSLATKYVDFTTGQILHNYVAPTSMEVLAALKRYHELCEQYEHLLLPGFFDFPLPGDIPEDLTLSFRDFVAKYNISAAVPRLFELTGMGVGDIMNTATMYVMQAAGAPLTGIFFGETSNVVPMSADLCELYSKIGSLLGHDVLYSSTVVSSVRGANDTGVTITVRAADGTRKRVEAKRLLLAIEPSEDNMAPFDLDESERTVFSKFQSSNVYVGAVRNPSLVVNQSLTNMPATAESSNWTTLPLPPFNSRIDYFGQDSDLFRFLMVANTDLGTNGARDLVVDGFAK
ncbi:hypothetical protein N8I77_001661 [Diaporthe amygdali]|uniref:Amine oxidase domain-containing protein n=1 Tax=Phomopsis amygdali TaxID=1214568 RepID=A0AAD9W9M7_PHOAM|nr:hypothetical protein N8I77_001661 [Diaporthe amygdali]